MLHKYSPSKKVLLGTRSIGALFRMHPLAPHRRPPFPRLLLYNPLLMLLGYLFLALAARVRAEEKPYTPTVHTVFGCECGGYFNWQSIGMIYSHKKSGQVRDTQRLLARLRTLPSFLTRRTG